ncbi:hypothetical protein A9A72_10259, partial [Stutzerimonas stutzeri]
RHGAWRPATGLVLRRRVAGFYAAVDTPDKAKVWGQLSAAVAQASIANRSRNVPDCQAPSPHHCDLPNFVVRGYDDFWMCKETHDAPPIHFLS